MAKEMQLAVSKGCLMRLLKGVTTYEILSHRAFKFQVGTVYSLYGIPDAYVKVMSSDLVNITSIPSKVWDAIKGYGSKEEYIRERCGEGAWMLNSRVYVLLLMPITKSEVMQDKALATKFGKKNLVPKFWLKNDRDEGLFISKNSVYDISGEVADSQPYCVLCDEHGDKYRDFLCKAYGVTRDKLNDLKGWLNRNGTRGDFLPRRVYVSGGRYCRVRDITDEEWNLLGIDVKEDVDCRRRIELVDKSYWEGNFYIRLYKYKVITNYIFEKDVE